MDLYIHELWLSWLIPQLHARDSLMVLVHIQQLHFPLSPWDSATTCETQWNPVEPSGSWLQTGSAPASQPFREWTYRWRSLFLPLYKCFCNKNKYMFKNHFRKVTKMALTVLSLPQHQSRTTHKSSLLARSLYSKKTDPTSAFSRHSPDYFLLISWKI